MYLLSFARHKIRRIIYSDPLEKLGFLFLSYFGFRKEKSIPDEMDYWDEELSGRLSAYIQPKISTISHARMIATLVGFHLPAKGKVLDLGCGGGYLAEALHGEGFKQYIGVDISRIATDFATQRVNENAEKFPESCRFDVGALTDYIPQEIGEGQFFDLIVFSEVLYYLPKSEDALLEVQRSAGWLKKGGLICVALKDDGKSSAILRRLSNSFMFVSSVLVQEQTGQPSYHIRINRERPGYLIMLLTPKS